MRRLDVWRFRRGKLQWWLDVLPRIDGLLSELVRNCHMDIFLEFDERLLRKADLLEVLRFCSLLLDNSSERNVFFPIHHVNMLLQCEDLEIVHAALTLSCIYHSRAKTAKVNVNGELLLTLWDQWSFDDPFLSWRWMRGESIDRNVVRHVKFVFDVSTNESKTLDLLTILARQDGTKSPHEAVKSLIHTYSVPRKYHWPMYLRVMFCRALFDDNLRRRLIVLRMMTLQILTNLRDSPSRSILMSKTIDLAGNVASMTATPRLAPEAAQVFALRTLDSMLYDRHLVRSALAALNLTNMEGIVYENLREFGECASKDHWSFSTDYVNTFLELLFSIICVRTGWQPLARHNILQFIVPLLKLYPTDRLSTAVRVLRVLEEAHFGPWTDGRQTDAFHELNGYTLSSFLIEKQIVLCETQITSYEQVYFNEELFHQLTILRLMLRFLLYSMGNPQSYLHIRRWMDAGLPNLLKRIVTQKELFGPEVYSMILAIMTFYLNEEPNEFSALHEVGLIGCTVDSIVSGIPRMGCAVQVIPNMIRAICLHQTGISLVHDRKLLEIYFRIFHNPAFVDVLENDTKSMYVGALCDELMRHVPALKTEITTQIFDVFNAIQSVSMAESTKFTNWEDILFRQSNALRMFSYISEVGINTVIKRTNNESLYLIEEKDHTMSDLDGSDDDRTTSL